MQSTYFPATNEYTKARVLREDPPLVVSPSWPILQKAADVKDIATKIAIAQSALKEDPGCILSRGILADRAETLEERIQHLRWAYVAGTELWGPVAFELGDSMKWWDWESTNPYVNTCYRLGYSLMQAGDEAQARYLFRRYLKLDPADHRGAGERLMQMAGQSLDILYESPKMMM